MTIRVKISTPVSAALLGPQARPGAEPDADDDLDEHRHRGQPQRHREGLGHLVDDFATTEGLAEVALEEIAHVVDVLLPQGLVEPELMAERRDLCGVCRLVSPHRPDWVTGKDVDHEENNQSGPDENRDHLEQSPCDVTPHHASMP